MPSSNCSSARPCWLNWAFGMVFLACIGGACAWFHSGRISHESTIRYEVRPSLEGYEFRNEPITHNEQAALATTNLISGTFFGTNAADIRVFSASWNDSNGKNLSVVQHTPDLCWVKAGWLPVNLGQPKTMTLQFGSTNLEFECRSFEAPGGSVRQLVVWSTLIGGKPLQESWRFQSSETTPQKTGWVQANRFLAANQFISSLLNRTPSERSKQFIRFSTPVPKDWKTAFDTLRSFGPKWIDIKYE